MSPRSLHLLTLLRMLRLVLGVVCEVMGSRALVLRGRLAGLPEGHRRRVPILRELRRIAWAREVLADPAVLDDAAFRGLAAERARVFADAGRLALVRRMIWPTPLARLAGAVPAWVACAEAGRCTGIRTDVLALPGGGSGRR